MRILYKKISIALSIIALAFFLIYGAFLYLISYHIANIINELLQQNMSVNTDNDAQNKYFTFKNSAPYFLLHSSGISLSGFTEEANWCKIDHLAPINIYYDIFSSQLLITYNGQSHFHYKPLEHQFGAVINGSYTTAIDISMINIVESIYTGSIMPILNNNQKITFTAHDVDAYDMIDKKEIFRQDFAQIQLEANNTRYYNSIEEYIDNIPQKYHLKFYNNVTIASQDKNIIAPLSCVYGLLMPIQASISGSAEITTQATKIKSLGDLIKNVFIKADVLYDGEAFNVFSGLKLPNEIQAHNTLSLKLSMRDIDNINLTMSYHSLCKKYTDTMIHFAKNDDNWQYLGHHNIPKLAIFQNTQPDYRVFKKVATLMEKHTPYIFDDINTQIKASYSHTPTLTTIQIENFEMIFQDSVVKFDANCFLPKYSDNVIGGNAKINGQLNLIDKDNKIINLISEYYAPIILQHMNLDDASQVIKDTIVHVAKSVSAYPEFRGSQAMSVNYNCELPNFKNSTIGDLEIEKFLKNVDIIFYTKVLEYCLRCDNPVRRLADIFPPSEVKHNLNPVLQMLKQSHNLK